MNTVSLRLLAASPNLQVVTHRVATTWPWYVVRAAGFVAAGLLILLMLSGIGQVTGLTFRFLEPVKAWALHKALALSLCVAIAIHVIFLWFDHFVPFSIVQLLVPFASPYRTTHLFGISVGSLWVALGIFAMYMVAVIVASSLGWINTKRRRWKTLHFLSYAVAFFVFLHALYLGSDLRYGAFRAGWILLGVIVLAGVASRLWRAGTLRRKTTIEPRHEEQL